MRIASCILGFFLVLVTTTIGWTQSAPGAGNQGQQKTSTTASPLEDFERRIGPLKIKRQNFTVVLHLKRVRVPVARAVGSVETVTRMEIWDDAGNIHYAKSFPCEVVGDHFAETMEISAQMLLELGVRGSIVGHSERRQHFGETDAAVRRKVRAALAAGLTPIVCVGETLTERDGGQTLAVVARQVRAALEGLTGADLGRLILAYEPVWAIGTGRTATPEQAQEVHAALRRLLAEQGGGSATRILYGGSVKAENAAALLRESEIDGALVGGASLVAEQFARIVEAARPA